MTRRVYAALCLVLLFAFPQTRLAAQMPYWQYWGFNAPLQPEQDACGALELCGSFSNTKSYFETGNVLEPNEAYSHWLKVKIATAGSLVFTITPRLHTDNYDFYVFKQSADNCNGIVNATPLRGNDAPVPTNGQGASGVTGLRQNAGADFTQFGYWYSNNLDVAAGDYVYIMINNYGPKDPVFQLTPKYYATKGYEIEFTGSTCTFFKGSPVAFDSVTTSCTSYKEAYLYLTKPVQCSSIDAVASDFQLNNGASIYTATGMDCDAFNYATRIIKLEFAPYLQAGNYTLSAKQGTDGNTLLDICGDEMPLPESIKLVVPKLDSTVQLTLCPQQLPYTWNGQTITGGGNNIATFTSPSMYGCDSLTRLSVTIKDTLEGNVSLFICANQLPYTWNGISVTTPGANAARFVSTSVNGCDSLTLLNLSIINPLPVNVSASGCGSVSFGNHTYYTSATLQDTVKSVHGCDSVYRTVDITVFPALTPVHRNIDTGGCGFLTLDGVVYRESASFTDTLSSVNDCDSVYLHYNITITPNVVAIEVRDTLTGCDSIYLNGHTYTSDTTVHLLFRNRFGCDSISLQTRVLIRPLELELTASPEFPVKGDYVTLTTTANRPYTVQGWLPPDMFPDQVAQSQSFLIKENDTFKVIGMTDAGCKDTAWVYLKPDSLIPVALMPNAFSPNGDGLNDEFKPFYVSKSGYLVKRFFIHNRWGQEVYHAYNLKTAAWNGLYGNTGKPADAGTYFYQVEIEFIDKTKQVFKGEVILVR